MQVELIPRNYKPTKRVRETVEDKAEKFQKYTDFDEIRFTLGVEKLDQICEIHLRARGHDFHVRSSTEDMLAAVDQASASMEKQLRRFKSKIVDSRKARGVPRGMTSAAALEAAIDSETSAENEPEEG